MHHFLAATVFAGAAILVTAFPARPHDTQTLSDWLIDCRLERSACLDDLSSGYLAAHQDKGEICPPQDLPERNAVDTELRWLQNMAAYNSRLADGTKFAAEQKALHTLWPCAEEERAP